MTYLMNVEEKNSCITYYELCLNEFFTSAVWSAVWS